MWQTAQAVHNNYGNCDFRRESDRNEFIKIVVGIGVTGTVIVKGKESRETLLRMQFYCYL